MVESKSHHFKGLHLIYIHSIGHYHPENMIDNQFLEDLEIETSHEWIMERVGIHSRRTILSLDYIKNTKNINPQESNKFACYTNAQTARFATEMALSRAGLTKDKIGMIISGSCTPMSICPAEACTIASELEIDVPAFDLNSACSTVIAQMNLLNQMDANALPDYILITIPENNTRFINYADRSASVLWGDCSVAMIVSLKIASKFKITETIFESAPTQFQKVSFPIMDHFRQDGRTVQTFAIKKTVGIINYFKNKLGMKNFSNCYFIGHQANKMMLDSICNLAEISSDKHLYNVDEYGNCGAAGAISVFSMNLSKFKANDQIIVGIVGAGLSWGGMLIEVSE